jgi:hypothetical protein
MRRIACVVAALGIVALAGPLVFAHHAFTAEFDANQPVVLKGAVSKTEWINPHSWVYIDVKDAAGKVTTWAIECGAPNALLRRGWNKKDLPLGTELVVEGYQAKNGSPIANAINITLPDGRKLFVGSTGTGAPNDPDVPK